MVNEFLKKMSANYETILSDNRNKLVELETHYMENEKFIKLLESETENVFKDFTPRKRENKNSRKITELTEVQSNLSQQISALKSQIEEAQSVSAEIKDAISEVKELEMAAEDSKWFEENVYDAGNNDEPSKEKLSDEMSAKLENILSFLLADPMRAKRELEGLLNK